MRYIGFLFLALSLFSCQDERLFLRGELNGVEDFLFKKGTDTEFKLEHNGEGVLIFRNGQVVSESNILTVDDRFTFGTQRIRIVAYRGTDTASQYFRMTVVPSEAPMPLAFEVVNEYPHPSQLFTQGLFLDGEIVIESSGQYGESALSTYKLGSTDFIQHYKVDEDWFAEGVALLGDSLYQITWRENRAQSYGWNGDRFEPGREFKYSGREGWGVAPWEDHLIWSDGTEKLRFVNPADMSVDNTISVTSNLGLFSNLNELEIYKGYIVANLWQTPRIVFVNPENGAVEKVLDLNSIANNHKAAGTLNGIMVKGDNLIITGKNWPTMYELEIDLN
ncbi:MAG: glutaminyl-peptide cyclotransferase [Flavobacteriia bacterium]|nr:glutaminyl-peptide cyclotransferase [Flavobacteriia bacterium]